MTILTQKSTSFNAAASAFDLYEHLRVGQYGVHTAVTTLTPEIARRLLERNVDNRNIRRLHVAKLAHAIRTGAYVLNGETIIVARDGSLNDGQHRCAAVVETGISIPAIIVFGVERETRITVDTGDKRTVGHVLAMHHLGEGNPAGVAALARFVLQFDTETVLSRSINFEPAEFIGIVEQNGAEMVECYNLVKRMRNRYRISAGLVSGAMFVCGRVDRNTALALGEQLAEGTGSKGDPAVALAKRYSEHTIGRTNLSHVEQAALFIKTFNSVRAGERVSLVKWISVEAFPSPR